MAEALVKAAKQGKPKLHSRLAKRAEKGTLFLCTGGMNRWRFFALFARRLSVVEDCNRPIADGDTLPLHLSDLPGDIALGHGIL